MLLVGWRKLTDRSSDGADNPGVSLERRVCFEEFIIVRSAVRIEQNLDNAKAVIKVLKQGPVLLVTLASLRL